MAGENSMTGMAVSAVVPVFPPSILTFAMTGGESAAAAEAAASLLSLAFLFGGIVGAGSREGGFGGKNRSVGATEHEPFRYVFRLRLRGKKNRDVRVGPK